MKICFGAPNGVVFILQCAFYVICVVVEQPLQL